MGIKSRQEIKAIAKSAMGQQRGTSILTILVIFAVYLVWGIIYGVLSILQASVLLFLMNIAIIFVGLPLEVHASGIFFKIYNMIPANVSELFSNFSVNFLRKVGGMLWMALFTFLWMLLFVIPGIIKGIAYSMTPFILADCPDVTAREALKLSIRMTQGHKMDLFVLLLSFIGWFILGALTLHILTVVFVLPYYYTTYAGFYTELKNKALATGVISQAELGVRLQ